MKDAQQFLLKRKIKFRLLHVMTFNLQRKKRSKSRDLDASEGVAALEPSEKEFETMKKVEKVSMIIYCDESNYATWDGLYQCFKETMLNPECLEGGFYPSSEKPCMIPLIYPIKWNKTSTLPKEIEQDPTWPKFKPPPSISADLIIKFLCLVHLNTTVGLKSQGFAYYRSFDSGIRYLGILSQISDACDESDLSKSEKQTTLLQQFSEMEPGPSEASNYILSCWIITHPTSSVF